MFRAICEKGAAGGLEILARMPHDAAPMDGVLAQPAAEAPAAATLPGDAAPAGELEPGAGEAASLIAHVPSPDGLVRAAAPEPDGLPVASVSAATPPVTPPVSPAAASARRASRKPRCQDCFFHQQQLCALPEKKPCTTFRPAHPDGLRPPQQLSFVFRQERRRESFVFRPAGA